jgi:hypothetical protein
MGYGLSVGTYTICAPNPQTRTSQPLFLVPIKETKSDEGVKNGHFLPSFELINFGNAERAGLEPMGVMRTTLRHYAYISIGADRF